MSMKLYVGNLSFQTSSNDLQELFSQAGTVESASVVEDRDTGRSRGFAFVEMATDEQAKAAIAALDGTNAGGPGRHRSVDAPAPRTQRGVRRLPRALVRGSGPRGRHACLAADAA